MENKIENIIAFKNLLYEKIKKDLEAKSSEEREAGLKKLKELQEIKNLAPEEREKMRQRNENPKHDYKFFERIEDINVDEVINFIKKILNDGAIMIEMTFSIAEGKWGFIDNIKDCSFFKNLEKTNSIEFRSEAYFQSEFKKVTLDGGITIDHPEFKQKIYRKFQQEVSREQKIKSYKPEDCYELYKPEEKTTKKDVIACYIKNQNFNDIKKLLKYATSKGEYRENCIIQFF